MFKQASDLAGRDPRNGQIRQSIFGIESEVSYPEDRFLQIVNRLIFLLYLDPIDFKLERPSFLVAKMESHGIDFARIEFLVWKSPTVKGGNEFVHG
jgi:hypothetical protein